MANTVKDRVKDRQKYKEGDYQHFIGRYYLGSRHDEALFQLVKKVARQQQEGKPIPYYLGVMSEGTKELTLYQTQQFSESIQRVYNTRDTRDECLPVLPQPYQVYTYTDEGQLHSYLQSLGEDLESPYHKVKIDINNILGWAKHYYELNPEGGTRDFIGGSGEQVGEIREPHYLVNFIEPYTEETNGQFAYILDQLNPKGHQKDLGTFYTPLEYAILAKTLVYDAIRKHQQSGNRDYIIIDRCAGTGNLELTLNDDVPDDLNDKDVLSHVVLNSYSYTEYLVLQERFGGKVLYINPPQVDEDNDVVEGKYSGTDALSEDFLNNPFIKQYIDDSEITVILYENPPYGAPTSVEHQKRGKSQSSASWRTNYLVEQMKLDDGVANTLTMDMINVFIWSAFKYYLRQTSDSYIVIAPIKYYKVGNLANRVFQGGYGNNRKHFNTKINSYLMTASWGYEEDLETESITLPAYNINTKTRELVYEGDTTVKKVYHTFNRYYDTRVFPNDRPTSEVQGYNGRPPKSTVKISRNNITNSNIVANLIIAGSDFNNPDLDSGLVRISHYGKKGFYLRSDNFIEKLPIFAASRYVRYNNSWTERGLIYKTSDGFDEVQRDLHSDSYQQFLKRCLFFTCLESQNHVFSFTGRDGVYYRNELCLDTTHGPTLASKGLEGYHYNEYEKHLLSLWERVLTLAKGSPNYQPHVTYGLYQILEELVTSETKELDRLIKQIKGDLKSYYNKYIVPVLFQYKYLK